ncbi:DUF3881 family protein [Oribacterium sp. WCC10]|uniref:DUF3881 family protein n=1 Tax=Oribacterium sp. WCC10 TaxID=1855343 RepID=UPI0008E1DCD6|nr:DUF3881 family protein [Oribacterium sp. WCC10]SFG13234.1 protein of unknown function [Oribacterium sp. WCC10]
MHKFLRTIGFSKLHTDMQLEPLIERAVNDKYKTLVINGTEGSVIEQYQLPVAPSMGICVVGERTADGVFHRNYYFPYMRSYDGTLTEAGSVERHLEKETYAGVLEDFRSGITLIFYVTNSLQLREAVKMQLQLKARQAFLTGLASEGKILLPIEKKEEDPEVLKRKSNERRRLFEAARLGDQEAIDTLTETDINMFNEAQHRMLTEDLYSVVETSFMPTGVECDIYSILGEIISLRVKENVYTHENVVDMKISCNDCIFHVAINESDLVGVPAVGRRFKGKIWMQGNIEFVEDSIDDQPDADN